MSSAPIESIPPGIVNGKYLPEGLLHLIGFNETTSQLPGEIGWTTPGVNGLALRIYWSQIQPNDQNDYDWSLSDLAFQLAPQYNRRISILIGMGTGCPSWLLTKTNITFFNSTGVVLTDTGNTTANNALITGLSNVFSAGYYVGAGISGPGIPAGAYIKKLVSSVSLSISVPCTLTQTNITITVTDRYPCPWDTNYQAVLDQFLQVYAARYDSNPNLIYVTMAGYGVNQSMHLCQSTTDDATLDATTYNGVTGQQLWLNAYAQICALWRKYFRTTTLMSNFYAVRSNQHDQALSIQAVEAFAAVAGGQYGIKWNNATPGLGQQVQIPYAWMEANSATNPVGLQPQRADPTEYTGEIVIAKSILTWFYEFYAGQLTQNQPQPIADNNYFISYVNKLRLPPITGPYYGQLIATVGPYTGQGQQQVIPVPAKIAYQGWDGEEGPWVMPPYSQIFGYNSQADATEQAWVPPPVKQTDIFTAQQTFPL